MAPLGHRICLKNPKTMRSLAPKNWFQNDIEIQIRHVSPQCPSDDRGTHCRTATHGTRAGYQGRGWDPRRVAVSPIRHAPGTKLPSSYLEEFGLGWVPHKVFTTIDSPTGSCHPDHRKGGRRKKGALWLERCWKVQT